MKSDDIITYCLDNYGYIEHNNLPYGEELLYNQSGVKILFLNIQEFDTKDDDFSNLNQPNRYRLSLCISKNDYDKLFSPLCPYDKKYICYKECNYNMANIIMPHPVKNKEYFIQCVSPQKDIFEKVLKELISLSYKRARQEYLQSR